MDGKANEAIVRFLAKLAGVPAAAVRIVSGFTGSTKIVEIDGDRFGAICIALFSNRMDIRPDTGSAAPRKA